MATPSCPRCSRDLTRRDAFCPGCGGKLTWVRPGSAAHGTTPVPSPAYGHGAPSGAGVRRDAGGFPFTRPLERDWVFWWAVTVMVLSVIAFLYDAQDAWVVADLVLGLPLNFLGFVLPVAFVRWLVRRARHR